ncbi:acyl carrier protein [Occallatibacter riparius]|uniref:Acyl carrier protein n=1 Tax=Occallatibacter riparius TaxID=1002689 RepID=A0A9J7BHC5_9BACT|nr:acyl carrier protein [Occallatibacter riparius]UWZ81921.1 acyl carrier protein [Occallatibacter riparius]
MQLTQIDQDVEDFVVKNFLFGQQDGLTPDESLLERGVLDSTGVLELIAFLEEHYAIKVEDDDVTPDNLDSVARISDFVSRKLGYSG